MTSEQYGEKGQFNPKPLELDVDQFIVEMKRNINELQTQDLRIPFEDLKIFQIKCEKIGLHQLPAGCKSA